MTSAKDDPAVRKCTTWRDALLSKSPLIRFLLDHLREAGCPFDAQSRISCIKCSEPSKDPASASASAFAAKFQPDVAANVTEPCDTRTARKAVSNGRVLLCAEYLGFKKATEATIAHELLHALDYCRAKIDRSNPRHRACTEIRAASLSGDCGWRLEVARGNMPAPAHHQLCVRRRAAISLSGDPSLNLTTEQAHKVIDEVWSQCFSDTWPFDEIHPI